MKSKEVAVPLERLMELEAVVVLLRSLMMAVVEAVEEVVLAHPTWEAVVVRCSMVV